jgi:hypothetical protein
MILDLDLEAKLLDQARKSGNSESAINELIDFYLNEKAPEKAVAYLWQSSPQSDIENHGLVGRDSNSGGLAHLKNLNLAFFIEAFLKEAKRQPLLIY